MTLATRFLSLPLERRALAFEQAAAGLAGQAVILEKDFWVSWLLGLLFVQPELAPFLVFKGGTSLSKVFGVIDRFSEDIDLCLVPEFVGADAAGFDALTSRVKRDAAVLEMQRLCADKVQQVFWPVLEGAINDALGTAPAGKWLYYELDVDAKSPILYFRYPTSQGHGFDYVRREVKLELGTLTDQQPTGRYSIAPLIAGVFAPLFSDWQCEVVVLELQRTFWEKATILHAEYHRPPGSPTPDRYARHYFDMVRLLAHADASQFLADKAQCERVVDWKNRVFARSWARYDLACHGTFRLVPPVARQADLARDYATMRPMFMTDPPVLTCCCENWGMLKMPSIQSFQHEVGGNSNRRSLMKILIYGINFTPELTGIGKYTGEMAATGRKYAEDHLDREAVLGSTARFPSLRAKRGNSLPRTK